MRTSTILFGLLIAATGADAQPPTWTEAVDAVFADFDSTRSAGCALGVIRDGELAYGRGYGMANLEHGVPIDTGSVFRIASTSKQFTAMATLLLDRQDELSLDDDVRKFIPELPPTDPSVTLRQLLQHTSGIRDYLTLTWLAGYRDEDFYSDRDVLDLLSRQLATDFEPGSRHSYSNSGYFLLSQVVQRVSGKSLRQFAEEAIFEPLGMTHSHFHDDHSHVVPRRAAGYAPLDEGGFAISQTTLEMVGDGGVFTSIDDLVKWDSNFYSPTVGDDGLLAEMQTPGVLTDGEELTYALGLTVDEYRGLKRVSHGGAFVGYRAQLIRFPTERTSVGVLCNLASTNPTRLALAVADLVLEARLAATEEDDGDSGAAADSQTTSATAAPQPAEFARWIGAYREVDQGFIVRVELEDDGLAIVFPWDETASLAPVGGAIFADRDESSGLRFEFDDEGMDRLRTDREPLHYERIELAAPDRDLEPYVGTYYSPEVDSLYRVVVVDDRLKLENADSRRQAPIDANLEPTTEDAFQLHYLPIEFDRGGDGKIAGFRLSAGRVKNLVFERQ